MKKCGYDSGFSDGYEIGYDDAISLVVDAINRILDSRSQQMVYETKGMLPFKTNEKMRFVFSKIARLQGYNIQLRNKLNEIKIFVNNQ